MAKPKKGCGSTISKTLVLVVVILFAAYILTDNDHTREVILGIVPIIILFLLLYAAFSIIMKISSNIDTGLQNMAEEIWKIRTERKTKKALALEEDVEKDETEDIEQYSEKKERSAEDAVRQYYQAHPHLCPPRQFTILTHTNTDVIENISTKYDFNDIPYVIDSDGLPPKYLLNGANEEKAKQDILALNGFLDIARDRAPGFPIVQISEDMLLFDPPTDPLEPFIFCCLQTNVFTKITNKLSKYPVSLHFSEMNRAPYRIRGSMDYFADGEVGKIQIFGGRKDESFELYCTTNIYDFLELRKIVYNGNTVYKSELADVQIPNPDEYKNTPKHQPKTEPKVITHYEEEAVYYTLSDTEIEDIQSVIEFVFDQFNIPSRVLGHRIEEAYTEFDLSVPDGIRIRKVLSFRDEIDIRIPKTTIDMFPDNERGVIVVRVKHRSEQVMVKREEIVETPIYEGRS